MNDTTKGVRFPGLITQDKTGWITQDTWGGFCEKTGLIGTQQGTGDI